MKVIRTENGGGVVVLSETSFESLLECLNEISGQEIERMGDDFIPIAKLLLKLESAPEWRGGE